VVLAFNHGGDHLICISSYTGGLQAPATNQAPAANSGALLQFAAPEV